MKAWFVSTPFALKVIVFLASALFLILLAYLFYLLGSFWISLEKLNLKERFAIKNDIIKTTAQILGGAFFLFGLYFTWQNLVLTQEKNRADLYMSQEKQTTDLVLVRLEEQRVARMSTAPSALSTPRPRNWICGAPLRPGRYH